MMSIQEAIEGWLNNKKKEWRADRAKNQLTLGQLIDFLESVDPALDVIVTEVVHGQTTLTTHVPGVLESYRGFYEDLALSKGNRRVSAGQLLEMTKQDIGGDFMGYKGGKYIMDKDTPLWFSEWGHCSELAIVGIETKDDKVVISTKMESYEL